MTRIRRIWSLLNLPCSGVAELMSRSADHPLTTGERWAMRTHTVYCTACRRYRRQLDQLRELMRRCADRAAAETSGSVTLPPAARQRIIDELRRHMADS